jgi:hypothetical protein
MRWRIHPHLKGRFLPQQPDDIQVIIHDGGPRITDKPPEIVWVTVTDCDSVVFSGRLLNQPMQLQTVQQGQEIRFLMPAGSQHPVLVTDKYLRERPFWTIHPCAKCGFAELFDAPFDLIRVVFPNTPEDVEMISFTSLCPLCGGAQVVESKKGSDQTAPTRRPQKAWWQFWKQ